MVESTALEMRRAFTGTVGSNPTLSAMNPDIIRPQMKRPPPRLNSFKQRNNFAA